MIDVYFFFELFNSPVIHKKIQYQSSLLFIPTRTPSPFCQGDPWVNSVPVSCLTLRLDKTGTRKQRLKARLSLYSAVSLHKFKDLLPCIRISFNMFTMSATCCSQNNKAWDRFSWFLFYNIVVRGGADGWGTAPLAGRSRVQLPMGSLKFFIDLILGSSQSLNP